MRVPSLLMPLLLAACSAAWPPNGRGGMAEDRWPAPMVRNDAPEGLEARMRCVLGRLEDTEAGARRRGTHSGGVAELDLAANRARREFAGGFYGDVARSLDRLAIGVDQLRAGLALPTDEGCAR